MGFNQIRRKWGVDIPWIDWGQVGGSRAGGSCDQVIHRISTGCPGVNHTFLCGERDSRIVLAVSA